MIVTVSEGQTPVDVCLQYLGNLNYLVQAVCRPNRVSPTDTLSAGQQITVKTDFGIDQETVNALRRGNFVISNVLLDLESNTTPVTPPRTGIDFHEDDYETDNDFN